MAEDGFVSRHRPAISKKEFEKRVAEARKNAGKDGRVAGSDLYEFVTDGGELMDEAVFWRRMSRMNGRNGIVLQSTTHYYWTDEESVEDYRRKKGIRRKKKTGD